MSHDVNKLPKWAQDRITQAEQSAEYWRDKMTKADQGDTNVMIRRYGVGGDIGLPPDSQVSFIIKNPEEYKLLRNEGRFDVRLGEYNRLEVAGVGAHGLSDQVRVIPRSSNLFYVELTPWATA